MIYSIILFILFSFVSYRLIGVKASIGQRFLSSILSFTFTTVAFYVLHLRNAFEDGAIVQFDHYTFLYFITLVVVSLGFSLVLEMIDNKTDEPEISDHVSAVDKIKYFVTTRLRYVNLLFIISRNGLLRSTLRTNEFERSREVSVALKNTLEEAGGIFVKFGQFLSTRTDLFPTSFLAELASLQESVQPVPIEKIKMVLQEQFAQPTEDLFQEFDETPLAAASMAQVHKAVLHDGTEVAVKILRPNLKKQLAVDIHILTNFAKLLAHRTSWAKRIGIHNLVEGFIQSLHEEIDFTIEYNNMKQMKEHEGKYVKIPRVYEEYYASEVIVMEFLEGINITQINSVIQDPDRKREVIHRIYQEMFTGIFEYGLFHADPHPGNILLLKNGQPAFIDFGSVGRLSAIQQEGFTWLLIGINRKNAESMVYGVKKLVENDQDINSNALEQAFSQFLAKHNFSGETMDDMEKELFELMNHYELRFFPDVAAAFRSLITLQGSMQAIDPDLYVSDVITAYFHDKANIRSMTHTVLENIEDDLLNFIPKARDFPKKIDNIVQQVEQGKVTFRMSLFADKDNVKFINSVLSLVFTGLSGFALGLLALGSLFLAQTEDPNHYSFLNIFGYSGLGLSVTMLIRVVIQSLKRWQ